MVCQKVMFTKNLSIKWKFEFRGDWKGGAQQQGNWRKNLQDEGKSKASDNPWLGEGALN